MSVANTNGTQAKRWCFTINNYESDNETNLETLGNDESICQYLVYGRESGANGTPHLQGYVVFKVATRFLRAKRLLGGDRVHLEKARGNNRQASEYCKKEGDFVELGTLPGGQGSRTDIDTIILWLDEFIDSNGRAPTEREVAKEQPKALLRYRDFMRLAELRAPFPFIREGEPRPWQTSLEEALEQECTDERSILFYTDENGGSGKTWFQQYMVSKHPDRVQLLQPAKYIDMAYTIAPEKDIFLINVPRGSMETFAFNFRILESLKDRMVFSPKYQPRMKVLTKVPHVVVFSNEDPPRDRLSSDRYQVHNLYNP